MITRADPPLPLARMRACALLTELRLEDLRFSRAEIAAWYAQMHGVVLAPAQIAALDQSGWGLGCAPGDFGRISIHGAFTINLVTGEDMGPGKHSVVAYGHWTGLTTVGGFEPK